MCNQGLFRKVRIMKDFRKQLAVCMVAAPVLFSAGMGQAWGEPQVHYLGEIRLTAVDFCREGSTEAKGQTVKLGEMPALYALLESNYGGNGQTEFKLPDLQGRALVGAGTKPNAVGRRVGETGGATSVTLSTGNMPQHTHSLPGTGVKTIENVTVEEGADGVALASATGESFTGLTGKTAPVAVSDPALVVTACIAVDGPFPSRN